MKHIFTQDLNQFGSRFRNIADKAIICTDFDNACATNDFSGREVAEFAGIAEIYRTKCFSLVIELVSTFFEVSADSLQSQTRGLAPICQARQICMYLLHTSLSISYPDVGRLFCRDRTTISHACKIVEDLRDDEGIDQNLNKLEAILTTIRALLGVEGTMMVGEVQ